MISTDNHGKWKKWSARVANTTGKGNKNISKRTTLSGVCQVFLIR